MMIGELSVLNEWIPEQMEPGTVFVLENARKKIPTGRCSPAQHAARWA